MSEKFRIGIVGCGNISKTYFSNAPLFKNIQITACSDLNIEAAQAKATEFSVKALPIDEIYDSSDVDIILNLTVPNAHAEVALAALNAGKHIYSEKPLATNLQDAEKILNLAKRKKLRVGCAPDTFLGAGLQTSRKILDDGWIGKPFAGTAMMIGRGPEGWHPNPFFFYQKGAGPMFDLGPYYVTALISLLGPVESVNANVQTSIPIRKAGHVDHLGKDIKVEVPTHYSGNLKFKNGCMFTMIMSWESFRHGHSSPIEIYGSEGSMLVPDPNTFGGPVKIFRPGAENWAESVLTHRYSKNTRILGVADMASAIINKRPHRCSGELAFHALEVMEAFEKSHQKGKPVEIKSCCEKPAPMPRDLFEGILD